MEDNLTLMRSEQSRQRSTQHQIARLALLSEHLRAEADLEAGGDYGEETAAEFRQMADSIDRRIKVLAGRLVLDRSAA